MPGRSERWRRLEERPGFAGALRTFGGFGGPFRGPPFLTVTSARGSLVALGVIRRGLRGRAARVAAAIHRRRRMGGGGHRRGRAGRGRWQRSVTLAAFAAPR